MAQALFSVCNSLPLSPLNKKKEEKTEEEEVEGEGERNERRIIICGHNREERFDLLLFMIFDFKWTQHMDKLYKCAQSYRNSTFPANTLL